MFDSETSRSPQTEADYRDRAARLLERFAGESRCDWDQHPQRLMEWLGRYRECVSAAYWRRQRAALAFVLADIGHPGVADGVRAIGVKKCSPARYTSAHKKKSVSDQELLELTQYLHAPHASQVSRDAHQFFVAGLITGMRPIEWSQCRLEIVTEDAGVPVDWVKIVVDNAKHTNGRSNGPTRTLLFKSLSDAERSVLIGQWRSVVRRLQDGTYDDFQRQCSDKIRYAARRLWPNKRKRIALYSGRHQSMANGKASGLPKNVIAAIHGHASDRTCGDHYGRKQFGKSGRVYAHVREEEVARVRQVPSSWTPPSRDQGPGRSRR